MRAALVVVAAASLAVSCRMAGQDEAGDRTIVVWEQEDAQVFPYIDSVFEAFKKLPGNEDVRVIRNHYGTEDLRQQFLTASIAGSPPDLLMSPSDTAGIYSIAGFIMPVEGAFDLSKYNRPVVEAITLDGHAWGVPLTNGNHLMMMYNKRLSPTPPQTTDELFEFCRNRAKALKLDACMAFNLGEPFWLMPWIGAFGGWPIDNKTPTLDTKPMRDAVAFTVDLIHDKKFVPMECEYNCTDALFKEGKVAFIINGDWAISTYRDKFGKDFGVARIPKLSATGRWPTPMVSGRYFMLNSRLSGQKLELVKRFVEFYTNEENQIGQVKALMRLPALTEAAKSKVIMDDPILRASMEQILAGKPMPMATEMRAVWDSVRPHLGRAINKKATPAEAVAKMQSEAVSKIKEMAD
ncbi:MAG: extracellular solute-binding protein [Elusimicrobiota bacterium]|jgi:arabinogalactan oligomer/maltooligosaccharide transport system substrate-binding protein